METSKWVDFRHVKDSVPIEQVFQHYGLTFRKGGDSQVRGPCPLPSHQSGDSKDSFGASIVKDVWSCQSESCIQERGGKKGGNVLDFVACMEGCSIRDAALRLTEWFAIDGQFPGEPGKNGSVPEENVTNAALKTPLQGLDPSHPYVEGRGIKAKTAKLFGVAHCTGDGVFSGRIVIPIHNESGELIGYCGRALNGDEPRYLMPAGFRKSLVLFNIHRAAKTGKTVVVVEGFFACMRLHQMGYPNVVALMGSSMSEPQEELLVAAFDHVVLLLDGDEAGIRGAMKAADFLKQKVFVRVVIPPGNAPPDEMPGEELDGLLNFLK